MLYSYLKKSATATGLILMMMLQNSYALNNDPHISKSNKNSFMPSPIKGKVLDSYGHPLQGVQISIKGNPSVITTNEDGSFEIPATLENVLVFQHPMFNVREWTIKNENEIAVRLAERYLQSPDETAVLYERKQRDEILGSVASVYTNQLTSTPASLYAYALPGRLPGLFTQQTRGFLTPNSTAATEQGFLSIIPNASVVGTTGPTDNNEILLSLRGQTPVTIVDGVQRDIYSLDPETIESVTVLKDALSSILLGQRSSRGVLLVTTKKAQAGPPKVSFTAQTGLQTPIKKRPVLNASQYAYLYNEARLNGGLTPTYNLNDFTAYQDGSQPYSHPNVDWFDAITKEYSPMSRYNLNINGGGNTARYGVSLGYFNQEGMFKTDETVPYNTNAGLERYLINSNINVNVTDNFNVGLQLFGRIQDVNEPGATISTLLTNLSNTPNNAYPIFNPNGTYGGNNQRTSNLYANTVNSGYRLSNTKDLLANIDLTYKFDNWVPGLWAKAKSNVSVTSANTIDRSKSSQVFDFIVAEGDTSYTPFGNTVDQRNNYGLTSSGHYVFYQASVGYDKQFGEHNVSTMILADQNKAGFNFDLPGTYTNIATKASYSFQQKYFAEAALTYSGYDRYRPSNQFGFFYAAGLGWNIANENFIRQNANWVNVLKVRATYGKTGDASDAGYFIWRQSYNDVFQPYNFGANHTAFNGTNELALANLDVTWEKAHKFNFGVDINLFNNHWQFTGDYFRDKYYDLMQTRGRSSQLIGNTYNPENIGINRYTGAEFNLTYQNNIRGFNYYITANASSLQSKVLFMDELVREYEWNQRTGQRVGQQFGWIADGLIQTAEEAAQSPKIAGYTPQPGDIKYKDLNNDGIINQFDEAPIGNTKPLIFYGTTLGFNFKGLDASMLIQGVKNVTYGGGDWIFGLGLSGPEQAYPEYLDRWTPENPNATYPRLTLGENLNNSPMSTFYLKSGDYFRVKNLEVGYTLPYKWTNKIKVAGVRLFANGQNLFTESAYNVLDPETQRNGSVYPIQKVYNTGVNIRF